VRVSDEHVASHDGSLVIASRHADAYSPEEVRFIALLVNQIALAIDDAVNFQSSTRAADRLRLLLDLTNRVMSTLDLRELLREASANIRRVMHCEGVGVTLPDADTGTLRLYALDFPEGKGIPPRGHCRHRHLAHGRKGLQLQDAADAH
jgi:formate hydrogenlyase transcriptional activator